MQNLSKYGWQIWTLAGMGLLVIVVFVLVALKPVFSSATSADLSLTVSPTNQDAAALKITALPTVNSIIEPVYGIVTSKALNLRANPSTDAPVVGSLHYAQIVKLVHRIGTWYQTETNSWLSALFIQVRQTYPEAQAYASELQK